MRGALYFVVNNFIQFELNISAPTHQSGLHLGLPDDFLTPLAPLGNQITVVAFQSVQLAQASFLQKNQTLLNVFLISVMLRWHRA